MIDLKSTHVYREIHEQPDVLARLLKEERGTVEALAAEIKRRDIQYVVIAARGTSDNAGRYAQYLLGAMNGLYVGLATPSLFTIYDAPPRFGNALVLGISQSGKSPDIVAVLAEARRQGALTAALTNFPGFRPGPGCRLRHRPARRRRAGGGRDQDLHRRADSHRHAEYRTEWGRRDGARVGAGPGARHRDAQLEQRPGLHRRALPVCAGVRHHRPRLQLQHGVRAGAQAQGDDLHRRRAVFERRLPPRPARADRPGLPGHHRRAVGQDAARDEDLHGHGQEPAGPS